MIPLVSLARTGSHVTEIAVELIITADRFCGNPAGSVWRHVWRVHYNYYKTFPLPSSKVAIVMGSL